MKNQKQLAFNLCLKEEMSFANFLVGENTQLVGLLHDLYFDHGLNYLYFWGNSGSGKSHLLNALCQSFNEHTLTTAYLPCEDIGQLQVEMLDDLESMALIVIDDIHLIAGNLAWEEKIFHCFNKMLASNKKIVITSNLAPQMLPFKLLDLKSRVAGGLIYTLYDLTDEEKIAALKLRAKLKGLELTDNVANFLLNHYMRDTKSLFRALDKLDEEALQAQRRLTIPFIKEILF